MTDTPFVRNFVETANKFESIFQPYAARRRKQVVESNTRLVHYTSAASGIEIIKTKRLWMRGTTCMSDFREVQHGFDILNRFFSNEANMQLFESALDGCLTGQGGVGMEAIALFNRQWSDIRSQTYVACISEHRDHEDVHGRLSMWRAFGSGARVALVFRLPLTLMVALPLNVLLNPVAYFTEQEVETEMKWAIESIRAEQQFLRGYDRSAILGMAFTTLMAAVVSLKHEGFAEEAEWRAIYSPARTPSRLICSDTVVIDGVPQVIYKLPFDKTVSPEIVPLDIASVLDRVIIGPTQYAEAMKQAFVSVLQGVGITDAEDRVVVSGIPIRT
jgi:hypothetical protein